MLAHTFAYFPLLELLKTAYYCSTIFLQISVSLHDEVLSVLDLDGYQYSLQSTSISQKKIPKITVQVSRVRVPLTEKKIVVLLHQ